MIAIYDKSELAQFGFEADRFVQKSRDRLGAYEWEGPCPKCPGSKTKLVVSNGKYWCRDLHFHGKLHELNGITVTKEDKRLARERQAEKAQEEKEKREKNLAIINDGRIWEKMHQKLMESPERIAELNAEGISLQSIVEFKIGFLSDYRVYHHPDKKYYWIPSFTYPHLRPNGYCINIRMRVLDQMIAKEKGKYLPFLTHLPQAFFPATLFGERWVVIVEGEKKAIILRQDGIPAVGLWGTHNISDSWMPWFYKRFDKRYLMFDADNPSVVRAAQRAAKRFKAKPVFPPGKPDDLLRHGHMTAKQMIRLLEL